MSIENDLKRLYEMRMGYFGDELLDIFISYEIEQRHETRFIAQYVLKNSSALEKDLDYDKDYQVDWSQIYRYIDAREKEIQNKEIDILVRDSTETMIKYYKPYRAKLETIYDAF